ncbi:MAG: hypothetical protein KJO76_08510 [Gammaproteobacteria bacterium]|nr:hypothetical protein [Gammaproteobacteria bacterium]MBT8443582.1 hypothetical protein [Gammaproteobacteria bacterium]
MARKSNEFSALSFLWRFLFALLLTLATYNPSGYSIFDWVRTAMSESNLGPEHFFLSTLLVIGWVILFVATFKSLNALGVVLAAVAIGTFVWMLVDFGLLGAESRTAIVWISLICLAVLLTVGLSWSHIWRRLTGQFDVDEVND